MVLIGCALSLGIPTAWPVACSPFSVAPAVGLWPTAWGYGLQHGVMAYSLWRTAYGLSAYDLQHVL